MVKITINDKQIEVEEGLSLIQACELAGVEIPRFCYHDRLKVAGNCRMCLVEVEKNRKPVASCAMPVSEGMVVRTDTPMIKKAREGVMEFLLINHPLDCPICDEGGECDLQDQAMLYARGEYRFDENKRAVPDKYMGPLIKTNMNRCIHCTRCIRFSTDIAGVEEMGAIGRGEDVQIVTYLNKAIKSELSGNMIDICPVGALTSKPYAFKARSWELTHTESIDVSDAVGSNIRIDSRGPEVMRVLPRLNESINEEWISDKTRFAYDGLKNQRLDKPYVKIDGVLTPTSWETAFEFIKDNLKNLKGHEIAAIAGNLADGESIMSLRDIMRSLGSHNMDSERTNVNFDRTHRAGYIFNSTISGIEKSDLCLLIGANPRLEASMINARIRKRWLQKDYKVYSINKHKLDLSYDVKNLGKDPKILEEILSGDNLVAKAFKEAKYPMMILGRSIFDRTDADAIAHLCGKIAKKYGFIQDQWNGFNVLHVGASSVAALDLGFAPEEKGVGAVQIIDGAYTGKIKFLYLLGADEIDAAKLKNGSSFVVYQGHHGDRAASIANVILPAAAYTEKEATYVNLEGRAQRTRVAVQPPRDAKEDWLILKEIANALKIKLPYINKDQLWKKLAAESPCFSKIGEVVKEECKEFGKKGKLLEEPIYSTQFNYYLTDSICRASKTMAKCVDELV